VSLRRLLPAALIAALLTIPLEPVAAQQSPSAVEWGTLDDPEAYPRPRGRATRVSQAPRIDGRLDEALWQEAEVLGDFIQSQPNPGALATEATEVRVVYDDQALYIGAMLYDSDPSGYVVQSLERDYPSLSTRDADIFGVTLDTFLDRRNSFIVMVNPYGAVRDGQTFNDSRNSDFGFDIPVEVQTARREDGWSAEMRIPWTGIRYDAGAADQAFGLNMLRRVRRKNEDSYWAPLERRDPAHRMSKAGTLTGLDDIPRKGTFSAKPYFLADDHSGSGVVGQERGFGADAGFDIKYGLTPGLTLDATVNTDFSQVEVDQERVNLTRFPLFFPEQRDFFVENSGAFTFGDQTERNYRQGASLRDFTLFHSRRIGLAGGRPVPILAGGRMSGTMGDWEVGVLDMRTDATDSLAGENFAVVRLRRKVADGTDLGAIFVDRSSMGTDDGENRSYGVDANVRLGALILNGYLAGTETAGATGDQTAGRLGAAYRDRTWNVSGLVRRIGDDFDPGVGFVRRTNVEHTYLTVGAHRQPGIGFLTEVAPYVEGHYYATLGDTLASREIKAGVDLYFTSGATLNASGSRRFERVIEPFEINGGEIPTGGYAFDEASLELQSSAGEPFSAGVSVSGGGYFQGDRRSVGGSFRWLVSHRLAVQGSADYNRIDLPTGTFTSSVYAGRVKFALSTRAFAALNVQYNEAVDQLVTYGRFNVIHGPLSDLFLVLTERRELGGPVLERAVTLKVTRLVTF